MATATLKKVISPSTVTPINDIDEIKTWGEAAKYTWKHKWNGKASEKTSLINMNHWMGVAGYTTPLIRAKKGAWWTQKIEELKEDHAEWTDSTLNRVISSGTTILNFCREQGLCDIKPPKFEKGEEGEHRFTFFTKEDVEKLAFVAVDVFDRPDLADALAFSAYTGVRQGELLKLKVSDVDWMMRCVWVGGKAHLKTKGKECRAVPMHDRVEDLLRKRCNQSHPQSTLFGRDWTNKDQLYGAFKKIRKHSGFTEDYVWHSLRHSFATWLGEVSHPRQIMELMGHKNIETTLRYCKPTDDAMRQAINKL